MIRLDIDNAEQIGAALSGAIRDFHGKAGKAGMREVGKLLAKGLRSKVGVSSGALRRSITSKLMTRQVKGWYGVGAKQSAMEVGALRKVQDASGRKRMQLYKFRWQEHGTRQHMIRAWSGNRQLKRQEVRKLNKSGQVVKRSVLHPGQKADRVLQDLLSSHESQADAVFTQGVGKLLRKHGVEAS